MDSSTTSVPPGPPQPPTVGWREWVGLPDLGIERIKAKIDTGARTSALHAEDLVEIEIEGRSHLRFTVHPHQRSGEDPVECQAPLVEHREVRSSSGQVQLRPVVLTPVVIGTMVVPVELTLTLREKMGFRMLIGRTALRKRFLVDPARSFLQPPAPHPIPEKQSP